MLLDVLALLGVMSSGPPDNPLPSDPGSTKDRPGAVCLVRHCQAGRRRPVGRLVGSMVPWDKKNARNGVSVGMATGNRAIQCMQKTRECKHDNI